MAKRTILQTLIIILADCILIWLFVHWVNPAPSQALLIFTLIPITIIVNLIIGTALYFSIKKLHKLFFLNSIISSIIMFLLFGQGISRYQNNRLTSYEFSSNDTTYRITHWLKKDEFSVSYSINPGSSTENLTGTTIQKNDSLILDSESNSFIISANQLYNFKAEEPPIKLTKVKY